TRQAMARAGLEAQLDGAAGLRLIEPQGYLDFLALTAQSRLVLTDSGGLQEDTTVLGIPCLTLRDSTERPITVEQGTNQPVGARRARARLPPAAGVRRAPDARGARHQRAGVHPAGGDPGGGGARAPDRRAPRAHPGPLGRPPLRAHRRALRPAAALTGAPLAR